MMKRMTGLLLAALLLFALVPAAAFAESEQTGEARENESSVTIVNCKTAVNIREKASSKSKILGTAKKGEKFDLIGKSGNWYKIDYNGKTAYVFHRYIKVS